MDLADAGRIALFFTIAVVAFVAYLNPTRNKAMRLITGLLTRRRLMPGFSQRAQLLFVTIFFSVLAVVAAYFALSP